MSKGLPWLMTIALLPALLAAPVRAQEDPEEVIKYRIAMMKALSGHMAASARLVRGKVSYAGHLQEHADALVFISSQTVDLFPEGSDFGETRALGEIWEQWDEFSAAADKAAKATLALQQAVAGGEGVNEAFKEVSESCKGCHKKYREEE